MDKDPPPQSRPMAGVFMIALGIALLAAGLSPIWLVSLPAKETLVEVEGKPLDVDSSSWSRRGEKHEEIYFSLSGKKFAVSTSLPN